MGKLLDIISKIVKKTRRARVVLQGEAI
jgi:hypothetical protein